jgi:hypothetical protein
MTGYEGPLVEGPTDDLPIEAPWEQWDLAR